MTETTSTNYSKIKNVLYLSYDGMTDPLGQSQVIPYLVGLSKLGYKFSIVSFEKPYRYEQVHHKVSIIFQENDIYWYPLWFHKKPALWAKWYDLRQLKQKVKQLCRKQTFDILHCRSYVAADTALWVKKQYPNCKFVFDMRGFWVDERIDGNIWPQHRFLYRFLYKQYKKKERQYFKQADSIISLTEQGKKAILAMPLGIVQSKITVIPCCTDFSLFKLKTTYNTSKAKQLWGIEPNQLCLSYLGGIGTWYLLEAMLAFYKELLAVYPNACFIFLTAENEANIFTKAEKMQIPTQNIKVRYIQRIDVPLYLSASDINVFFIKPCFSKKASSPVKLGETLAMGIPVITNKGIGDVADIVKQCDGGSIVNAFTQEALVEVVNTIPVLLKKDSEVIRASAYEYYNLDTGIKKYQLVYRHLLQPTVKATTTTNDNKTTTKTI